MLDAWDLVDVEHGDVFIGQAANTALIPALVPFDVLIIIVWHNWYNRDKVEDARPTE